MVAYKNILLTINSLIIISKRYIWSFQCFFQKLFKWNAEEFRKKRYKERITLLCLWYTFLEITYIKTGHVARNIGNKNYTFPTVKSTFNRRQNELTLRTKPWFLRLKGENLALPPPYPPCTVLPLFELPIENKLTPNLNEGDRGGVWISLFSEVTLLEYNDSTNFRPMSESQKWPYILKKKNNSTHFFTPGCKTPGVTLNMPKHRAMWRFAHDFLFSPLFK